MSEYVQNDDHLHACVFFVFVRIFMAIEWLHQLMISAVDFIYMYIWFYISIYNITHLCINSS